MNNNLKILIADDHPIMREGLRYVLEQSGFSNIKEAKNGQEALDLLLKNDFDVVTLDVEMPLMRGFEVSRKIIENKLQTKIIFLTMYKDEQMFSEAMDLGALGYVLKENAVEDIIECIKNVTLGYHYISPALSHFVIKKERALKKISQELPAISDLTKTELSILKLISENKTTKEIADELFISYKTVENHRANISKKLNLHGSHSLIKFAISNKAIL